MKKKNYETAKPSLEDYETAKKILVNIDRTERLYKEDILDIVAYFVKYKSIKNYNNGDDDITSFSRCLATAPWMGQTDVNYYKNYLKFLIDKNILKYDKLKNIIYYGKFEEYKRIEIKQLHEEDNSFEKVYEYIKKFVSNNAYITLKLSVFHARTIMDFSQGRGQKLVELIEEYPNLFVQILCVGKYSGKVGQKGADEEYLNNVLNEGADEEHLNDVLKAGILKLYELASKNRKQFKIRIVRDNIVDISLRTTILLENDDITFCHFKYWRPGYERAIYGNTYEVDPKSSLALQINQIFDEAFYRAIPSRKNFGWLIYQAKRLGKLASLILILFALNTLRLIIFNPIFMDTDICLPDILREFGYIFCVVVLERIINFIGRKYYDKK